MSFHSRDGLYFARLTDGTVRISCEVPVHDSMGNFAQDDRAVLWSIDLPENEWASVVASVTRGGETSEVWTQARALHAGYESTVDGWQAREPT